MSNFNRRQFLKNSAILAGCGLFALPNVQGFAQQYIPSGGDKPADYLTAYAVDNHQAWFRKNNTPFLSYRAHTTQKYPYFFPVSGPKTGLSLTSETGQPWPHHRSLFFGCDKVNGSNFWQDTLSKGQIVSQGIRLRKVDEKGGEIHDRCLWKRPEQEPIIEDKRVFTLRLLPNGNYLIDAEFVLKMLTDIRIEKTNHGLYAIRCAQDIAPDSGGTLLNSEGDTTEANTFGKSARWCTFFGKRTGFPDVVEGIALLTHKEIPHPAFENCPWFTRDYGNISPMPMNWLQQPLEFAANDELRLKYRVVAYSGTPQEADLDGLWEEFNS
ncbi:MAG: PmoA family protein [Thermoguttaceae bacterium]